jgi:bifunctional non-homologous end joining protein LigD
LKEAPPSGPQWLHELKLDGYRIQVHVWASKIKFLTRSGLEWTARMGTALARAFRSLGVHEAIIDGELVVEGEAGVPEFGALQDALAMGRSEKLRYFAFDLLFLGGLDLRPLPLVERKEALRAIITAPGIVRFSEHFHEDGPTFLRHACLLGVEGVVSKRSDAPYRSGRTNQWVKVKCFQRQEFVIAGYVPSTIAAKGVGSLVLSFYDNGKLIHAGRVGTGFSDKVAADIHRRLEPIRIPKSPFARKLARIDAKDVRFVEPQLVCEVEFRAWSSDGLMRHATFKGLREDKCPEDVRLETG